MSQTIDHSPTVLETFSVRDFTPVAKPPKSRLGADFIKLWVATALSNLSDGIRVAALPLLAAAQTSDPRQIAGVMFATQAPWLVFGIASGAVVDRFERRRLIAAAHLFRMAVVVILASCVAAGAIPVAALYVAAFLLGTAETLFDNATQVIVPQLVDEGELERANGRQTMAMLGGQHLVGPLAGAALFAASTPAPLIVDAALLCCAAVLVLSISKRPVAERVHVPPTMRNAIGESLRWLWAQHTLRAISLAAAVVNVAVMAHVAVFVLFALEVLGVGGVGYAAILACYALGGIVGGWISPRISAVLGWRWSAVLALVVAGSSIVATGATSSIMLTAAMQVVLGIAASVWMVVTCSLRQRLTPDAMLGRVTGAHALLSWGGAALGALAGGMVAAAWGLRAPFLMGGAALVLIALGFAVLAVDARNDGSE